MSCFSLPILTILTTFQGSVTSHPLNGGMFFTWTKVCPHRNRILYQPKLTYIYQVSQLLWVNWSSWTSEFSTTSSDPLVLWLNRCCRRLFPEWGAKTEFINDHLENVSCDIRSHSRWRHLIEFFFYNFRHLRLMPGDLVTPLRFLVMMRRRSTRSSTRFHTPRPVQVTFFRNN
jgi:hypothetical protein